MNKITKKDQELDKISEKKDKKIVEDTSEPIEVEAKPFIKGQTVIITDGLYKGKIAEVYDVRPIFILSIQVRVNFYVIIDGYLTIQIDQNLLDDYKPKNDKKGQKNDKKDQNPVKKKYKKEKSK